MHHRAGIVDVDEDAAVQEWVPGGGAEETVRGVEHEDVAALIVHPDGLPEHVVLLRALVDALDGAVADVDQRHLLRREREVAAVGCTVEEDVVAAAAQDAVHLPRRVQGGAVQRQGDVHAVLVGVEVRAVLAVAQPQVHPVGEELHRRGGPGGAEADGGEGVWVSWFLGAVARTRRAGVGCDGYVWATRRAGEFEGHGLVLWFSRKRRSVADATFHWQVGPARLLGP